MHNLHVFLGFGQHVASQDVHVLYALIFHQVAETLFLHTRHVQDVGTGYYVLVEVFVLHIFYMVVLAVEFVLLGHGQFLGSNEVERGVEVAHGRYERVNGASVLQVAYQIDVEVFQCALCLVDGIKVQKALRGVHVCTVSGIDDRHGSHLARILCRTLYIVAHGNDVGIVAHHEDGVLERLALRRAGGLGIGETDDARTKSVGCGLEAELGTGGGFEEKSCHDLSFQQFPVGMLFKLLRHLQQVHEFFLGEVGNRYKVMSFHSWVLIVCFKFRSKGKDIFSLAGHLLQIFRNV